jgi:L-threonylcarbamoyladenylate synthase
MKERGDKPFSIWVPSIKWIKENCVVDALTEKELDKLPGAYTFILKLKKKRIVANEVTFGKTTIGVRYPDHWFSKVVEKLGFPIVTTSANKTGEKFMTSLENLDKDIEKNVEFIIYEGPKEGKPSKIINLVEGTVKERD